ncbi:MAG: DNA-binding protein [Tenericutes bacterium HGW-Tenericutes-1]|jgi:hypothetical protein|nr:MAG: DNA-binding protein [Tenericutes bacterium HGW-Tenericutes-1]
MDKDLDKKIRIHQLYDLYGALLTEKQKTAFEYYYLDDYSLSEIAEILKVSRNAIHEQITIAATYLEDYEHKLGLLSNREKLSKLIEKFKKLSNHNDDLLAFIHELEIME